MEKSTDCPPKSQSWEKQGLVSIASLPSCWLFLQPQVIPAVELGAGTRGQQFCKGTVTMVVLSCDTGESC